MPNIDTVSLPMTTYESDTHSKKVLNLLNIICFCDYDDHT